MIFHPQKMLPLEGAFVFSEQVCAVAHPCLNKDIIREFWRNFSYQVSDISLEERKEYVFLLGRAEKLPLDGHECSIHVTKAGICVHAENEQALLRGFMTLLDRFEAVDCGDETAVSVACCRLYDQPAMQNRMVHYCIFPETQLWELKRFVRFCGALKYTHIVLEFWGMLKYDCMKELAWPHAYTKAQVAPIIREAQDLGMEVIPMFNHWGHAAASRVMHGKHVVLDQNPALQTYFSEDGWCWDIRKDKVKKLLRSIRGELTELCGPGGYFHIGCDEAYGFEMTQQNMDFICDFINEISDEMKKAGRRVIAWGDMFLYRYPHYTNKYSCNAPSPECEAYMVSRLSRDVLIADWQYHAKEYPVETASVFARAGFDCLLCPWDEGNAQMKAVVKTIQAQKLQGIMHTTWHTLTRGLPYVTMAAIGGYEDIENCDKRLVRTQSAALLRRVMPVHGDYEKAGWSKIQVHSVWN